MYSIGDKNDPKHNGEGYKDFTAYKAIRNVEDSDKLRHSKMIGAILRMCELADFRVECKIVLRDKRTGKLYE